MKLSTSLTLALGLFLAGFFQHSASAALLFSWKQTGSDVTAMVSGTIDAAWGNTASNLGRTLATRGGYGSAFDGFGFGPFLQYGDSTASGYVEYYVDPYFANPSISGIAGFLVVEGGVVQAGSTPYFLLEVNSSSFPYLWLEVLPGTTTINSTVVWSNKLLSDFFTAGVPVRSEIFNSSNDLLLTLEIGDFAPVPVPEPGQVAASLLLLVGIGGYLWRKHRNSAKASPVAAA